MKIIMMRGLPASGKSTWAKQYQKDSPNTIRVNKDELRAMLHNSVHSKGRENFILAIRDSIVMRAVSEGHDVIVDDTNFNSIHQSALESLARILGAEFEVKDFTDVSLEECIKRDQKRQNYVGEKVIKQMYNQYLKPKIVVPPANIFGLSFATICDLDGTLALFGNNNPYERDFFQDDSNVSVRVLLKAMKKNNSKILIVSGRKDTFKEVTEKWLKFHGIEYDALFMRKGDDDRKDAIIKSEIYETEIKGKYNIDFVIDDRNQVVEFWRSLGLTVLQVAEGDF